MKLYTRLSSLLLAGALILSLTACTSGSTADESPLPSATPSPTPSDTTSLDPTDAPELSTSILPTDFVADPSVEDLCLAVSDVPGDFELFTVNGVPVTAYTYLYWLTYNGYNLESSLASYGIPLDWNLDPTMSDSLKEAALTAAARYSIIINKAKELGFELTQAQLDELTATFALAFEYAGGEEAFREELRQSGLDYDTFYELQATSYYYSHLYDGLFANRPTAEEMDTYIEENDLLRAKHILLMTVDATTREPLDEATIAQKKATAESILSQLQSSSDLLTDFDALMHEHSEDPGLVSNPDGYTFSAGEMIPEFETATRELEFGQISGIVEASSTGYHIILRLDPDTEANREDYLSTLMTEQIDTWIDEADIILTQEYEALDAALCYEKFIAYQQAFAAEAATETQGDS